MKAVTAAMKVSLAKRRTTLATCLLIVRKDATELRCTDLDRDITITGWTGDLAKFNGTYSAELGFVATNAQTTDALNVDNQELQAAANVISEDDLRAGLWDGAAAFAIRVNYEDLTQKRVSVRSGWLGEVSHEKWRFTAELRGLMQALATIIGQLEGPACPWALGDENCTVDLTPYTVTGSIDSMSPDGMILYMSDRAEPGPTGGVDILSITNANPGVVTTDGPHGLAPMEPCMLSGITGPALLNTATIALSPTANTFELSVDTSDTAVYPAYTGGGKVTPLGGDSGYFDHGVITITSGANIGRSREVRSYVPGQVTLILPFPDEVEPAATYEMHAGCDYSLATCRDRFNNVLNHGGEPYLPGNDRMIQVARRQ